MLFINLLIHISQCTIIGIDLGSSSIKIAINHHNKHYIIPDYYNRDATPNIFAFRDQSQWAFGEGAIVQCTHYPETCIEGLPLDKKLYFSNLRGYQITALALKQIIRNAEYRENVSHLKVIVAIPPSMTSREKSYLYTSLTMADIDCIQFVTTTYAPVVSYLNGLYSYSPIKSAKRIIFIDIGYNGVRVSGFEYKLLETKQTFGLFDDNDIGGLLIDTNLLELALGRTKTTYQSSKYQKYMNTIRRAREMLSKVKEAKIEVNSKTVTLTQSDVDTCSIEIKDKLNQMIHSLKENQPDLVKKSREVIFIGGCSQTPCLQEHIKKLLPNQKLVIPKNAQHLVSLGASEISTTNKEEKPLVTSEISLKIAGTRYTLFDYNNYENFNPVIRLNDVHPDELFEIVERSDDDNEFIQFRIKTSSSFFSKNYKNTVDLGFTLNYYLMPVPDDPMLISSLGLSTPLSVEYQEVGWEISQSDLDVEKKQLYNYIRKINQDLKVDIKSNEIESFKSFVQDKLNKYIITNWRRIAFAGIKKNIDSRFKSCLKEYDYDCPQSKINEILEKFKSLVKTLTRLDISDYEYYNYQKNSDEL